MNNNAILRKLSVKQQNKKKKLKILVNKQSNQKLSNYS